MKTINTKGITAILFLIISCSGNSGKQGVVTVADVGGNPDGVTVTDSGNIYITDISSGAITHVNNDGTVTAVTDPTPSATIDHPDGITSVTTGTTDILYVADTGSSTTGLSTDGEIIKIEVMADGTVNTTQFVDSTVLNEPTGIAVDNSGNIYVADQESGDIYKIPVTGGTAGTPVSLTDSSVVSLDEPHGLTLVTNSDNSITLYTTDQGTSSNNIVQINISASGTVTAAKITPDNPGGTDT